MRAPGSDVGAAVEDSPAASPDSSPAPSTSTLGDRYRLRDGARLAGDVLVSTRPLAATRLNAAAVAVVDALGGDGRQINRESERKSKRRNGRKNAPGNEREFRSVRAVARESGAEPAAVDSLCERLRSRGFLEWRPARDPDYLPPASVVVTVRNDRENLRACLDALAALSYPTYEAVVVDDGSTDGTREVSAAHRLADEGRLRVVSVGAPDEPLGIGASRNRGVEAAAHDVVAFTDADCRPRPDWLSDLVPHLAAADIVGGRIRPAGSDAASAYEAHNSSLDMGPYASRVDPAGDAPYLATANVLGRRNVFEAVPFPERNVAEDVDVCWRALDAGFDVVYVPAGVVEHAYRSGVREFAGRRAAYGASEALLAREYGREGVTDDGSRDGDSGRTERSADSVGVSAVLLTIAALVAVGTAAAWPAALAVCGALLGVAATAGGLRRWRQYRRLAPAIAAGDVARSWGREGLSSAYALSREATRYYALPLALVGALGVAVGFSLGADAVQAAGAGLFGAVIVAVALPLAVEYRVYDPDVSFAGYAAYYLADHLGYQRGVYRGALVHRTVEHLRPGARFRLAGVGSNAIEKGAAAVAGAVRAVRSP